VTAALDDSPRPGKEPTITEDARAWVVSLACRKPKELGYPHELWTTRLLARHVRETAETVGHRCLTRLAQGTVCKILDQHDVQPHKVRYYLECRDEAFEQKMAEVLCVYREVAVLRENETVQPNVAIISYDEKPGIQAIRGGRSNCTRCAVRLLWARNWKNGSNTPARLSRQKRFQMLFHLPNTAGRARHVMLCTVK
jgi:Homeodomain-like domain